MDAGALLAGLVAALSLAAAPGPMNALIARESSRGTWLSGFRVGVAAPIADTIYLAVLAFSFERILIDPVVLRVTAAIGACLMAWFAWGALQPGPADHGRRITFVSAFAMAMLNPYQIGWWLTGGFHLVVEQEVGGVIGFLCGIFLWVAAFAYLCHKGADKWTWFTPLVAILSADLLVVFALALALKAFGIDVLPS